MRKRYVLLIAVLFLVFVAGLAWQLSQPREPMYEGRPLSYWLEGYSIADISETAQQSADTAMREIGTNAIPTLLRMLEKDDSPLKLKFFALVEKQQFIKIRHVPAGEINYEGMKGFEILGASAKGAVPSLVKIYERNISKTSLAFTAVSLGAIGPDAKYAVPILLKEMSSTNVAKRYFTTHALGMIHCQPELVVPVLIKHVNDQTRFGGYTDITVEALGKFGADAKPAIPALITLLNKPDLSLHIKVLSALKQIDPQAITNLPTNLQPVDLQARP